MVVYRTVIIETVFYICDVFKVDQLSIICFQYFDYE